MQRLPAIDPTHATGRTKELLDGVQAKLGMVPNLMRTMANASAVLEAYLSVHEALALGALPATLREQIALTVAEVNGCDYCLAAHAAVGKLVGLSHQDILDSRQGVSPATKVEAALQFARRVVDLRGRVGDEDIARLRRVGYGDGEIAEIVAHVALSLFSNYFNHVADTVIDFPVRDPHGRRMGPHAQSLRRGGSRAGPARPRLTDGAVSNRAPVARSRRGPPLESTTQHTQGGNR